MNTAGLNKSVRTQPFYAGAQKVVYNIK